MYVYVCIYIKRMYFRVMFGGCHDDGFCSDHCSFKCAFLAKQANLEVVLNACTGGVYVRPSMALPCRSLTPLVFESSIRCPYTNGGDLVYGLLVPFVNRSVHLVHVFRS